MAEYRQANVSELRAQRDAGDFVISGYGLRFNRVSDDLGGFRERFEPGAFKESLRDNPGVLILHSHQMANVLARAGRDGTAVVQEDNVGLFFRASLPQNSFGRFVVDSIERGDIKQMSIGFIINDPDDEEFVGNQLGNIERVISRAELLEISTVALAAPRPTLALG